LGELRSLICSGDNADASSWYFHLLYSADVVAAKGALAEDLINREYSFPIIVALYGSSKAQNIMMEVPEPLTGLDQQSSDKRYQATLSILQANEVKGICMGELDGLKGQVFRYVTAWGRTEKMTVAPVTWYDQGGWRDHCEAELSELSL